MEREKMIGVVEMYLTRLKTSDIPRKRMDPSRTFESLSKEERLAHAHYLCKSIRTSDPAEKHRDKMMRHFASAQMCLSFAGWYTLQELMDHNRALYD